MIITKRRVVSEGDVVAMLDELAHRYQIAWCCYDESMAERMSEFDALKWLSLCSQRVALKRRQSEAASSGFDVPSQFRSIYEKKHGSQSMELENTCDTLSELAA